MEIFLGAFTEEWEQRRAALLHERSLGRPAKGLIEDEDEITRRKHAEAIRFGGGGPGGKPRRLYVADLASSPASAPSRERTMTTRLTAVARGSQPAVVKLASYGSGARLGAMTSYVSREGRVAVEDENGNRIESRDDLARLRDEWDHLFLNRAETRDIAAFVVEIAAPAGIEGEDLHELVRGVIAGGLGQRSFAYGVRAGEGGALKVEGLVVLRGGDGERLSGDDKAAGIVQVRYDAGQPAGVAARFAFQGYGNGVSYGSVKLRDLVDRYSGDIRDSRNRTIADHKQAADLVQKEWRHELHSRKARDVMHLVMSARAGTDKDAFNDAVRDFLAAQFAGHRYIFAMHDPDSDPKEEGEGGRRPHVHAHAIVTMRSEDGERIQTTPEVFRQWRSLMAEKARDHGIEMEMTDRREFASAPAYGRTQVRPVSRQGRTEHEGTSKAAHARYEAKRSGRRAMARSQRSINYARKVTETWREIAMVSGDRHVTIVAEMQQKAIIAALSEQFADDTGSVIHADLGLRKDANTVNWREGFSSILEAMDVNKVMTRDEFYAYERNVRETIENVRRSVPEEERQEFGRIADRVFAFVELRRREVDHYHDRRPGRIWPESEEIREARRLGVEPSYGGAQEIVDSSGGTIRLDEAAIGKGAMDRIASAEEYLSLSRQHWRDPRPHEIEVEAAYEAAGRLASAGNRVLRQEVERSNDLRDAMHRVEAREAISGLQNARNALHEVRHAEDDLSWNEQQRDAAMQKVVGRALEGNRHVRDYALHDRDVAEAIAAGERDEARAALDGISHHRHNIRLMQDARYAARFYDPEEYGFNPVERIDLAAQSDLLHDSLQDAARLGVKGNRAVRAAAERDDALRSEIERQLGARTMSTMAAGHDVAADAAREVLDEIAWSRAELERFRAGARLEIEVSDHRDRLQWNLSRAAELAVGDNNHHVRDAAANDPTLAARIAAFEQRDASFSAGEAGMPIPDVAKGNLRLLDVYERGLEQYGASLSPANSDAARMGRNAEDLELARVNHGELELALRSARETMLEAQLHARREAGAMASIRMADERQTARAEIDIDEAIARHGEKAVREGNELLDQIDAADVRSTGLQVAYASQKPELTAQEREEQFGEYADAVSQADELVRRFAREALDGNTYLYEFAQGREYLHRAIDEEVSERGFRSIVDLRDPVRSRPIERHGEAAVREGDALFAQIDAARRVMRQLHDENARDDKPSALVEAEGRHAELLREAATVALDGNNYVMEMRKIRPDLNQEIHMEIHRRVERDGLVPIDHREGEHSDLTPGELVDQIKASRQAITDLREEWASEADRPMDDEAALVRHDAIGTELREAEGRHQALLEHAARQAVDGNSYLLAMRSELPDLDEQIILETRNKEDRDESYDGYALDERLDADAVSRYGADAVRHAKALIVQIGDAIETSAELREPEVRYDRETGRYSMNETVAEYEARMDKLVEANDSYEKLVDRVVDEALDDNPYLREVVEKHATLSVAIGTEISRRERAEQERNASGRDASRPVDRAEQASRPQETMRTDPPQQHVPRQNELRRQEQERGGDEQER